METITGSVGREFDGALADELHRLEHANRVERIYLPEPLVGRRRFRATSDRGTEFGIVLDQDPNDIDGLVLLLEPDRAVVLHRGAPETLVLRATDVAGGIQLGWHAGHLHWRVRTEGDRLVVLLDAPADEYLTRITTFLDSGQIEVAEL
ncbi:hypothetical protein V5H98_13015 [Georgenia sp. M64]|uniref:hypothetical protein n=1 Tax=Georgenia sp. M64 TaxID=3120520 RepID=UPI0030DF089E